MAIKLRDPFSGICLPQTLPLSQDSTVLLLSLVGIMSRETNFRVEYCLVQLLVVLRSRISIRTILLWVLK